MAAEVTIDSATELPLVQDSTHPYNEYLQCVGTSTTVNGFALPSAEEGNTLTISNGGKDNLGLLAAAGFLQYADGNVVSNVLNVQDSKFAQTLYGGYLYSGNGNVEGNVVTVIGSDLESVRAGQISGESVGNISGNSTIISGGSFLSSVYGVYHPAASGAVTGNSITISDSSVSYAAYGASHSGDSGEVANNSLTLRNSTVQEFVYGARFTGLRGVVKNNLLTIEGCDISKSSSNIYAGQLGFSGKGEGDIIGNILTISDSVVANLSAGFHRGSSGNVENNHVIMENSTQSGDANTNRVIAGCIYQAGTSGNISGNTATIINSSVLEVEGARHQGKSGDVTGNVVTMVDSQARSTNVVFLARVVSDEVSDNHLMLQGDSVVSGDACVVGLADDNTATTVKNLFGNSVTLCDTANVGGNLYAWYEGGGRVENAGNNSLVIDGSWTGVGNETTSFAEDSLNQVINFDAISVGWSEAGRELNIAQLTTNDRNDDALTIRLNAADTVLKVGTLNNVNNKDIVVEGTAHVRDALGEGAALRQGLERLAAAVQVEDKNSTEPGAAYTTVPASAVKVAEGLLYGAVSADIDAEGNVIDGSVVETSNGVNDSLTNITASRQLAYRTQGSKLTRRLRELRTMPGAKNTCWARATSGSEKYSLPGSNYRRNGFEAGTDRLFCDGRYVAGLAFGYADTKASFANGRADEQLYTLGTYVGWQGKQGQYVDFVAKYSRFDTTFDLYSANGALNTGDADTWGGMLSLDYGWRLGTEDGGFYAEPYVGLMYGFLDGADFTTSRGASVREDYTDSFIGTVGVTVGYIFAENRATAYARAALHHDWTSEAEVHLSANGNSRSYREDLSGSYGEWAVGGTYRLGENTWVFGEFQTMEGVHVRQPWQLNIGTSFGF